MPERPHPSTHLQLLIPFVAFLAILPLLIKGPTCGHDFDFHLLSWLEAATQLAHGQYPHWAYTPAFNAGEPRFLFYPPISWTLGALLTLIFPIQYAGTAFTFVALTLAGFTAHRLARTLTPDPNAAILAAVVYTLNPYMLFTAYERSAFAELLAAAFLPLLFQAALTPRPKIPQIAIPIALIWLTNAPAGVMSCYALAIFTATRLLLPTTTPSAPGLDFQTGVPATKSRATRKLHLAIQITLGTALGLALPAFYLIPAAYEQRWVQITLATVEGMRPQDHFLFHRMPGQTPDDLFHNAVVRTASQVALILLTACFGCPILSSLIGKGGVSSKARPHSPTPPKNGRPERSRRTFMSAAAATSLTLLPLTLLIAFLLTPLSTPLWNHIPKLAFLQFPWRLSALLATIFLTLIAPLLTSRKPTLIALITATILILPAYTLFHQPCDATDTPIARAALFHSPLGTEATDEYTPTTTTDPDAIRPNTPPYWLAQVNTGEGCGQAICGSSFGPSRINASPPDDSTPGQAPTHLTLTTRDKELLILNRRNYPAWTVLLNGRPANLTEYSREDGLIILALPPGTDTIDLQWHRTPDQTLGLILSLLALILLVLSIFLNRRHKASR